MKNLLATLTFGLSGAVLFSSCAPDQYAQSDEYDDLYFTKEDRHVVNVVKLNNPEKATYSNDGSYVYQEEVASKNFNPDAVDVEKYQSNASEEPSDAEYYVSEEDRAYNMPMNANQFNGARPAYASYGNPHYNRARYWNDPFYSPYYGGSAFYDPYFSSFNDPFYDPFYSSAFYDPFYGPRWYSRPGFNISFGMAFGNAWGWGRPYGWGRPFGYGSAYRNGFYDGMYASNPYNRYGYYPNTVVINNNNYAARSTNVGRRGARSSRTIQATDRTIARRGATSTRTRSSYTASRDALNPTSKNDLTRARGRASTSPSSAARYRSSSATQASRAARTYDASRTQRSSNSTYTPRSRQSSAPSQMRRQYNNSGNSNYSRPSYDSNRSRTRSYGNSNSSPSRSRNNYNSSPSRSSSGSSYSSGSRGGSSYSGGGTRSSSSRSRGVRQ